jgi:hypothetical protein
VVRSVYGDVYGEAGDTVIRYRLYHRVRRAICALRGRHAYDDAVHGLDMYTRFIVTRRCLRCGWICAEPYETIVPERFVR